MDFLNNDLEETGCWLFFLANEIDTLERQLDHMHNTLGTSTNKTLWSTYGDLTEEEEAGAKKLDERELMSRENISMFDTAIARVEMLRESCKVMNETLINKQKDIGTQERQPDQIHETLGTSPIRTFLALTNENEDLGEEVVRKNKAIETLIESNEMLNEALTNRLKDVKTLKLAMTNYDVSSGDERKRNFISKGVVVDSPDNSSHTESSKSRQSSNAALDSSESTIATEKEQIYEIVEDNASVAREEVVSPPRDNRKFFPLMRRMKS